MPVYLIIIIAVISALAGLALFLFALAAVSYKIAFGNRADKNPLLKYFTASDFNLNAEPITVKSGKTVLNGYIYTSPKTAQNPAQFSAPVISSEAEKSIAGATPQNSAQAGGRLIIFAHGMGAGQIAYTTEIARLCQSDPEKITVLALDSAGCNFSQGKSIKGMFEGAKTVLAAINFAKTDPRFRNAELTLIGHSWGGYSVLCASALKKVEKVIAISAPLSPVKTMQNAAKNIIGKPLAAMLCPFWRTINFFKFGKNGNMNAATAAKSSNTPTLLIHGDGDKVVSPPNAVFYNAEGAHIKKYLAKGKAHNPYNTQNAEQKLKELNFALLSKKLTADEKKRFFEEFDFSAATEEDEEVMQTILSF